MRILLAGTGSGCGKTTASLLVMAALRRRGLRVAPYKVGPDYIDPGFHQAVCGRPSHNLDTWLMAESTLHRLLHHDADIAVIEGVMGYYDGLDAHSLQCSTWETARVTRSPVLLVVDASGGAASVAATVRGFQTLRQDSGIAGVLVNRASGERHYQLVREAVEYYTGLPCVGYLTKQQAIELPSRHLGLVPAVETPHLLARVEAAVIEAEKTLDLERVLALAAQAPALPDAAPVPQPDLHSYRLGVARDAAFHFYYQDNLDALRRAGMELCFFSPLKDAKLPQNLNGLYIGGGFPEVFARDLAANSSLRSEIFQHLANGLPCYAECGGLMYLGQAIEDQPMVGFLPLTSRMTPRLQRFGYVTVTDRMGLFFPAHEFHHAVAEPSNGAQLVYTVRKAAQTQVEWQCGYERKHTLAAFAHVHFGDRPDLIRRFFT